MNRLIILGNGFDLAHGMATGYGDFIRWYLGNIFGGYIGKTYSDEGVSIYRHYASNTLKEELEAVTSGNFEYEFLEKLLNNTNDRNLLFTTEFRFPFLKHILLSYSKSSWVDIEEEYYSELLSIAKEPDKNKQKIAVDLLNQTIELLKIKLNQYLSSLPTPTPSEKIENIIKSSIKKDQIIGRNTGDSFFTPSHIHVLSFNYTDHLDSYFSQPLTVSTNSLTINYIHGKIKDPLNPLIFGFGDEMDDHYKILEKLNYNGFLDNIKSFGYFKTDNYHRLIRFLEQMEFEVFLMGHSCGLSDRVMLNMIFEHKHCQSIRVFYHETNQGNNHQELTQQISRHFNQKTQMRVKVVPLSLSEPLPQSSI